MGEGSDVRKKKPAGKQIALCLLLTAAVDGLGVLLVTLLAVKGIVGEDRVPQALGALAFCAAFAGGLPAGKGGWVRAGAC